MYIVRNLVSFFKNLQYTILSLLFVVLACVSMCLHRDPQWLSLSVGLFFYICTSVLSLHWERWGMPFYIFYIVVAATGVSSFLEFVDWYGGKDAKAAAYLHGSKGLILCGVGVWMISLFLSGLCLTVERTLPDVRNVSLSYVNENGIQSSESLSEGYTTFCPRYQQSCVSFFLLNDTGIKPKIEYAAKRYLIISDSFKTRYFGERDRYPQECAVYEYLDRQYDKTYQIDGAQGSYQRDFTKGILRNIVDSVSYLTKEKEFSGGTITIYDLAPHIVRIKNNATGLYLRPEKNNGSGKIRLSDEPFNWVLYENDNKTVSLVSSSSDDAISISTEGNPPEALIVSDISGDEHQQWTLSDTASGASIFVFQGNYALSMIDNTVCLSAYTESADQLWTIEEA